MTWWQDLLSLELPEMFGAKGDRTRNRKLSSKGVVRVDGRNFGGRWISLRFRDAGIEHATGDKAREGCHD